MLKRLFTAFLTAVMVMSCVTVMAEDKPKGENIFGLWGDFENEEYWDGIVTGKVRFSSNMGAEASIADIGANGSSHSLKIVQASSSKDFWFIKPAVAGETYDLSVMVKTDSDNVESFRIYNIVSSVSDVDLTWLVLPAINITPKDGWVEYKTTFTVPNEVKGNRIPGDGKLLCRFDDGTENFVAYIDNLSMVPHGNVPDFDYGAANSGLISYEEGD